MILSGGSRSLSLLLCLCLSPDVHSFCSQKFFLVTPLLQQPFISAVTRGETVWSSVPQILRTEADQRERPVRWDNCVLTVTLPLTLYLSAHLSICHLFLPISLPGSLMPCSYVHTHPLSSHCDPLGVITGYFWEQLLFMCLQNERNKQMHAMTFGVTHFILPKRTLFPFFKCCGRNNIGEFLF